MGHGKGQTNCNKVGFYGCLEILLLIKMFATNLQRLHLAGLEGQLMGLLFLKL